MLNERICHYSHEMIEFFENHCVSKKCKLALSIFFTSITGWYHKFHIRRGVRIGQRNAYLFLPYFYHRSSMHSPPIRTQTTDNCLPTKKNRDSNYKPREHHYILTPRTDIKMVSAIGTYVKYVTKKNYIKGALIIKIYWKRIITYYVAGRRWPKSSQ